MVVCIWCGADGAGWDSTDPARTASLAHYTVASSSAQQERAAWEDWQRRRARLTRARLVARLWRATALGAGADSTEA